MVERVGLFVLMFKGLMVCDYSCLVTHLAFQDGKSTELLVSYSIELHKCAVTDGLYYLFQSSFCLICFT